MLQKYNIRRAFQRWIEKDIFLISLLLLVAFVLRLQASHNMPLVYDEGIKILLSEQIYMNRYELHFPIGVQQIEHSFFSIYFVKLGFFFFDLSVTSSRLFFVLLGTFSLYFIYRLTKEQLGKTVGLVTLFFLTFDQFLIGESCQIREEAPLLFFSALSINFFFKGLEENKRWLYASAVFLGLGYLCKEIILILLAVYIIYAYFALSRGKYCFSRIFTHGLISLGVFLLTIGAYVFWGIKNNFYHYWPEHLTLGFSLRSIYLYLGEAIMGINYFWNLNLAVTASEEFPIMHLVSGLMILVSGGYYLVRKNDYFVAFCLLMFWRK